MRKTPYVITALFSLVCGAAIVYSFPALADTANQIFTDSVVFQKVIDVAGGIKNSTGPVKVKDNLKVTGNLTVDGSSNIAVSAQDVLLGGAQPSNLGEQSYLQSETLQQALNNELAIDLSALLPGTTWSVTNVSKDSTYEDTTGQMTFNEDGTITLDSGRVAVAGWVAASENSDCSVPSNIQYTLYNNNVVFLTWDTTVDGKVTDSDSAAITIFANSTDSIGMIGTGGCGELGADRISVLEKVEP